MKKKSTRHVQHRVTHRKAHASENYLVVVRSWMIVVAFALMLGLGAMVGQFIGDQISATTPQVAGVQTEAQ